MNKNFHIVISGERGVGKSTLIRRLLESNSKTLCGFVTQKTPPDEQGCSKVFIHPAGNAEKTCNKENQVGTCTPTQGKGNVDAFNTTGVELLKYSDDCLLVMDELGYMESDAVEFQKAVLKALDDTNISIIAVAKNRDTEFLKKVKNHPSVMHYEVTTENRDTLFDEITSNDIF